MNQLRGVSAVRGGFLCGVLGYLAVCAVGTPAHAAALQKYPTAYYEINTDHDIDMVREAAARLTAMAEEYHRRTMGFAGKIRRRLPFYLFSDAADYKAMGGIGAGVYKGSCLMAYLPKGGGPSVWHVVQHEGFHQFVDKVMGGRLPIWANEGLAEYFGHGIWTGDGFVTGVIPPSRLGRVKTLIGSGKVKPFLEMLLMTNAEWQAALDVRNYDQAWSMVHFLVHAEDGKYRDAFSSFLRDLSGGTPPVKAFRLHFGGDVDAFQKKYSGWWVSLPDNPTEERYVLAVCQTLTSYLARAHEQKRKFQSADEFFAAARNGELKTAGERWLPPTLLESALAAAQRMKTWSIDNAATRPRLVLKRDDRVTFTGTFTGTAKKGFKVDVDIEHPGRPLKAAP